MSPLDPKHARFCQEYIKTLRIGEAAKVVGVTKHTAFHWMQRDDVQAEIERLCDLREKEALVSAAEVLSELVRIALADPADAFTKEGALKSIHDMPPHLRKTIAGIKSTELWEGAGKDRHQIGELKEIKFWDKTRGLEMLARHLALFRDALPSDQRDADTSAVAARVASILDELYQREQLAEEML